MSNDQQQDEYASPIYAWYVVGVLTVAYVFSFIDRQILNLMVVPIKRDLEISDSYMGLLMGPAFAIFYTLFGIPLGRLADTKSRRSIISLGIAFWSLMTAGCGMTKQYWDLALMRMGVGVGEAALSPAAYSLIADYFPPHRRSTAMSVYSMGIYVGSGLSFILGGMIIGFVAAQESFQVPVIGAVRNWQMVFFVVGLPGLLVALLLLTVKEPTRKMHRKANDNAPPVATFRETMAYVLDNKATFISLNIGIGLVSLNSYACSSWIPSMFIRRYEWLPGQTGLIYGTIVGIFGTLGVVSGGWLADRWLQQGKVDAPVRVAWLAIVCNIPSAIIYPLAETGNLASILLIPMVFFGGMPFGVAPAAIQRMMPNTMRAQATAIYLFVINIIGMGIGPIVTATLTDYVFRSENAIHKSLQLVGIFSFTIASVLLGISLKNYRGSMDYLHKWTESQKASA